MRTGRLFDRQERSDQPKPVPQMEEQHRDTCGMLLAGEAEQEKQKARKTESQKNRKQEKQKTAASAAQQ